MGRFQTDLQWVNDTDAIVIADSRITQFNYLTGTMIQSATIDNTTIKDWGSLSPDGKNLIDIDGGFPLPTLEIFTVNLETGKRTAVG